VTTRPPSFACRGAIALAVLVVVVVLVVPAAPSTAAPIGCTLSFKSEELVAIGDLAFTARYPIGVELVGSGPAASCRSLVRDDEPVTATFWDDDAGTLSVELASVGGFPGLNGLASCDLQAAAQPDPASFSVTLTQALAPGGQPLDPPPLVSILDVYCPTTTTTLPPVLCGDANGDGLLRPTDALLVLQAAVSGGPCPLVVCDVDGDGAVRASDALRILRVAVGGSDPLLCPA